MKREITYFFDCDEFTYNKFIIGITSLDDLATQAVQSYRFENNKGKCIVRANTILGRDDEVITTIRDILKLIGIDKEFTIIATPMEERKEIFSKLLVGHDWTYQMSDDNSVYKKGDAYADLIQKYLDNNPEKEIQDIYDEANPFNNNKTII